MSTSEDAALQNWSTRAAGLIQTQVGQSGVGLDFRRIELPGAACRTQKIPCYTPIDEWLKDAYAKNATSEAPLIIMLLTDGLRSTEKEKIFCSEPARKAVRDAVALLPANDHLIFLINEAPRNHCPGSRDLQSTLCGLQERCSVLQIPSEPARLGKLLDERFAVVARAALRQFVLHISAPDSLFDDVLLVGRDGRYACSGVAVGERAVLTAKHCLPATEVRAGEGSAQQGKVLRVIEAIRHPDPEEDLAMLRLDAPLEASVKLRRRAGDTSAPSALLRHVGFGAHDLRGLTGFGQKKVLDFPASGWGCDGSRVATSGCRPGFELVLPGGGGRDTCSGDSGGPVYELLNDGLHCRWRLVALTSRRVADAAVQCGSGGIYERVDAVDGWISGQLVRWREKEGSR